MNKILMYHSIGSSPAGQETGAKLYNVSEDNFHDQMEYIAKATKETLLTFDDGLLNNYRFAFPALKEFELRAYFFIIVTRVGTHGYMNWEKIKEMHSSGMLIGSHGMTHTILNGLSDEKLNYEIKESKKILEDKLGARIDYFSVPRGFYDKKVVAKTGEAGYGMIFTSNPKDADGFKFGRVTVKADWDLEYFKRALNDGLSLKDRTKEFIKNTSKKMLGARNYDRIRTKLLK